MCNCGQILNSKGYNLKPVSNHFAIWQLRMMGRGNVLVLGAGIHYAHSNKDIFFHVKVEKSISLN